MIRSVDEWLAPRRPSKAHPAFEPYRLTQTWLSALRAPAPAPRRPRPEWPTVRGKTAGRVDAEAAVSEFFAALRTGDRDRLAALLSEDVWVAHPSGRLGTLPRAVIVGAVPWSEFADRELKAIFSYDEAALQNVLPGGVATALAARLPVVEGRLVCGSVRDGANDRGRCTVFAARVEDGWRVGSLPLAAVDLAWRSSARAAVDERASIRAAHRVVRAWAMGHTSTLAGLRNLITERIWTPDRPVLATELSAYVAPPSPRFDRLLWTVGPTSVLRPSLRPEGALRAEAEVRDALRMRGPDLVPVWTSTPIGPLTAGTAETKPWYAMTVELSDRSRPDYRAARVAAVIAADQG